MWALVKKRGKALLVPYIIFSCINFGLKFGVLYSKGEYTNEVFKQELVELFITGNGTVWFLTCLFFVEILYYGIKKFKMPDYIDVFIAVISGALPFVLNVFSSPILIVMKRVLMALAFYYIGYFLVRISSAIKLQEQTKLYIGIACLVFGWMAWHFWSSGINYYGASFSKPMSSITVNLLNSIGYIGVLSYFADKDFRFTKILDYFGRNSLIVMVIHPIILMCYVYPIGFPIEKLSGMGQILFGMTFFGLMLLIHIPIIYIMNHYFPWMIGKKKKYD